MALSYKLTIDDRIGKKQTKKWALTATNVSDFCREACTESSFETYTAGVLCLTNVLDSFEQVEVLRLSNLVVYRNIICDKSKNDLEKANNIKLLDIVNGLTVSLEHRFQHLDFLYRRLSNLGNRLEIEACGTPNYRSICHLSQHL